MEEILTRVWGNLVGRVHGPLTFRLILQPAMAVFLAIRAGIEDAREDSPIYFWALFTHPAQRPAGARGAEGSAFPAAPELSVPDGQRGTSS